MFLKQLFFIVLKREEEQIKCIKALFVKNRHNQIRRAGALADRLALKHYLKQLTTELNTLKGSFDDCSFRLTFILLKINQEKKNLTLHIFFSLWFFTLRHFGLMDVSLIYFNFTFLMN